MNSRRKEKIFRWASRIFFLSVFFLLVFFTRYPLPGVPVNIFFRLNPLAAFTTSISTRRIIPYFIPGLLLILVFIFVKRKYFCRWACPLGTSFEIWRGIWRRTKWKRKTSPFPYISFYILAFFLGLAIFSLPLIGLIEPFSILLRAFIHPYLLLFLLALLMLDLFIPQVWCSRLCPLGGFLTLLNRRSKNMDFSRRRFIFSFAGGVILVPLSRLRGENPYLLRPPGARPEKEFVAYCIRCGECMKVCLSKTLHPSLLEGGLEGLWTPHPVFRIAPCQLCFSCGKVCPSGAIKRVSSVSEVKIGTATINRKRCIAWKGEALCLICMEYCPVQAIWADEKNRPYVVGGNVCIGCGQCENHCPVEGAAAIRVFGI
ncbi:MAG: 4Fe-4S binding protein [Caldiserica bacterium]|nr:4Fe-4S binding protein [Caldisericota bacterium]